jgi:ribosomal protein S18 acetylase RimI-like enzyme
MFEEESSASSHRLTIGVTSRSKDTRASGISAPVIDLVAARPADESFLYQTFASTRAEEMALTGWNTELQETFLRMQYEAQRRSYIMQLPDAKYSVIRRDQIAVGRLIVDRTPEEIHIVDIALLPQFRRLGIGSTLMKALMEEASQAAKTVRLHVERFNPALRWYERLGFMVASSGPIYLEMVWQPCSRSPARDQSIPRSEPGLAQPSLGVAYVDLSD